MSQESTHHRSFTADTRLEKLPLSHSGVVLDEVFHVLPPPFLGPDLCIETVADLAKAAGLDLPVVVSILERLCQMNADCEITGVELAARLGEPGLLLLDVREPWEFALCHLPGSRLWSAELWEDVREATLVVTICHHGIRSYSAAMYFRSQGMMHVKSLAGGVEDWALTVDSQMPRY